MKGSLEKRRGECGSIEEPPNLGGAASATLISCRRPVFLVRPSHHDLERIIRQWPLQRLRLVPRRAHPDIALLIGHQDHRHRLRMDRLDDAFGDVVRKP